MGLWLDTNLWLYKDTFFIAMSARFVSVSMDGYCRHEGKGSTVFCCAVYIQYLV